jgi:hypothetical protein
MVRKGSPVRVRQRALGGFDGLEPNSEAHRSTGRGARAVRGGVLVPPRRTSRREKGSCNRRRHPARRSRMTTPAPRPRAGMPACPRARHEADHRAGSAMCCCVKPSSSADAGATSTGSTRGFPCGRPCPRTMTISCSPTTSVGSQDRMRERTRFQAAIERRAAASRRWIGASATPAARRWRSPPTQPSAWEQGWSTQALPGPPGWGPGGRRFKSCLPDSNPLQIALFRQTEQYAREVHLDRHGNTIFSRSRKWCFAPRRRSRRVGCTRFASSPRSIAPRREPQGPERGTWSGANGGVEPHPRCLPHRSGAGSIPSLARS